MGKAPLTSCFGLGQLNMTGAPALVGKDLFCLITVVQLDSSDFLIFDAAMQATLMIMGGAPRLLSGLS